MKHYIFPITQIEINKKPSITGYGYIKRNEDKLIEVDDAVINNSTYDRPTLHIVYNDEVYNIYRDYIDITNKRHIYLVIKKDYGSEI